MQGADSGDAAALTLRALSLVSSVKSASPLHSLYIHPPPSEPLISFSVSQLLPLSQFSLTLIYQRNEITMHLVLTGATGLVGGAVLQTMLTTPAISKISILSRRPVAQAEGHPKAHVIIHKDFANYDAGVLGQLKDVDGVVWAQGISSTKVGKEYVLISDLSSTLLLQTSSKLPISR